MPSIRVRMTPLFWGGGRSRPSQHAALGTHAGLFKFTNHSGMSQIDEYGCGTPKPKLMPHPPPLRAGHDTSGHCHVKCSNLDLVISV